MNYKKCILIFISLLFFGCSTDDKKDEIPAQDPFDLAVEMTISNAKPVVGTSLYFTITITNNGPVEAKNVNIVNMLSSGYDFDGTDQYFLEEGEGEIVYDEGKGVWTIEKMPDGAIVSLYLHVTVKSSGDYTNKVTVSNKAKDLDQSNDSVTITTVPKTLENVDSLLNYEIINDEVTIAGRSELNNGTSMPFPENYTIPSHIDGFPVTKIVNPGFSNAEFVNLTIPNTVTTIGSAAFSRCEQLKSVTMTNSVTSIGRDAFSNCERLESIVLSDNITNIGDSAFQFCKNLESINIPDGVTSIGQFCFFNCVKLKSISLPNSVIEIGSSAFRGCDSLESITLSQNLKEIKPYTFFWGDVLNNIDIPNSVTKIGQGAFQTCIKLENITIGTGVTDIGEKALLASGYVTFKMIINAKVPPKINTTDGALVFGRLLNAANGEYIKVPAESVDAYKNAEGWSEYKDVIISQ